MARECCYCGVLGTTKWMVREGKGNFGEAGYHTRQTAGAVPIVTGGSVAPHGPTCATVSVQPHPATSPPAAAVGLQPSAAASAANGLSNSVGAYCRTGALSLQHHSTMGIQSRQAACRTKKQTAAPTTVRTPSQHHHYHHHYHHQDNGTASSAPLRITAPCARVC